MQFLTAIVLIILVLWLVPVLFMRGERLDVFDLDDGSDVG